MMVTVPQFPWYGDTELELSFPDSWEVTTCRMAGQEAPKLDEAALQAAFDNPIGTDRISSLARGKKEAVIIFDDLSRPTRVAEIVPYVLRELAAGGIKEENIRFIASLGAHGAMKLMDFAKKLGPEIPQRFPVYNHNPFANCTYLGKTSYGSPVSINSEVMACDLKIAIGVIMPHHMAGFGGGAKAVVPGVAHMDTIFNNHHTIGGRGKPTPGNPMGQMSPSVGIGKVDHNLLRLDMEEAARMAGLDVSINAVVNLYRDTVGLFIGDMVASHREAVKLARETYLTEKPAPVDIVVANAYSKASEAMLVVPIGAKLIKETGGDLVVTANIPEGQICHYLARSFGKNLGGPCWGPRKNLPQGVERMFVLGPYIDRAGLDWMGPPEVVKVGGSWPEILAMLQETHGDSARVAVIPDATLQYFAELYEGAACT